MSFTLRLSAVVQLLSCLVVAATVPSLRVVALLFVSLAFVNAWAAFRLTGLPSALERAEEKLVKRVVRRLEKGAVVTDADSLERLVKERLQGEDVARWITERLAAQFELFWPVWASKLRAKASSVALSTETPKDATAEVPKVG